MEFLLGRRKLLWIAFLTSFLLGGLVWAEDSDTQDLSLQLVNLQKELSAAEHIPGPKGLEKVKYYMGQIHAIETKLGEKGLPPAQDINAPWSDVPDKDKDIPLETHPGLMGPHDNIEKELRNITHKLQWVSEEFSNPKANQNALNKQMNALLRQREVLQAKKKALDTQPYEAVMHHQIRQDALQGHKDSKSADPYYERHLQEELQSVYEKIYRLRNQSLHLEMGADLSKLGREIAKLERQEKNLKHRLSSVGATPESPRVLDSTYEKAGSLKQPDTQDFQEALEKQIAYLDTQIDTLREKIENAKSGNELAQLGNQLNLLQHQRMLLAHDLNRYQPYKEAIKNAPTIELKGPWGQQKDVPPFFKIKAVEEAGDAGHWGLDVPAQNSAMADAGPTPQTMASTPVQRQAEQPRKRSRKLWDVAAAQLPESQAPTGSPQSFTMPRGHSIAHIWGDGSAAGSYADVTGDSHPISQDRHQTFHAISQL